MRLTTKLSGIVAVGGVAALGAGLISSGGVGAVYTNTATATGTLNTGTMHCQLAGSTGGVHITGDATAVTFDLGQIKSSEDGSEFGTVRVANTGTMGLVASWSIVTSSEDQTQHIHPYVAKGAYDKSGNYSISTTADQLFVPSQGTSDTQVPIGFQWANLDASDQGKHLSVTYKVDCFDTQAPPSGITLLGHDGGHATYNGNAVLARLDDGGAAGFFVDDVATLPASAPVLIVANETAGVDPYWKIRVNKGTDNRYITGSYSNGSWTWEYQGTTYDASEWSVLVKQVADDEYTPARAYAQIANGPNNVQSADFTCMRYGDSASFGNDC